MSSYQCSGDQLDNEGVIHFVEQVLLSEDVTLFPELRNLISVDLLDGDSIASGFNLCEPDLPIGAFSDDPSQLEIVDRVFDLRSLVLRLNHFIL